MILFVIGKVGLEDLHGRKVGVRFMLAPCNIHSESTEYAVLYTRVGVGQNYSSLLGVIIIVGSEKNR